MLRLYSYFLLLILFSNCSDDQPGIVVELPIDKRPKELCDYYAWATFYEKGELLKKDTTIANEYNIPVHADSVSIYASGGGYFEIIDTAFRIEKPIISLAVNSKSLPYFDAHLNFDKDVHSNKVALYTEDYEYYLIDSIYQWSKKYGVSVVYHPWDKGNRKARFVYNCLAAKHMLAKDSSIFTNLGKRIDSLTYLELDVLCGKNITADSLPILPKIQKINFDLAAHIAKKRNRHIKDWYQEEMEKHSPTLSSIIEAITNDSNYAAVQLAEIYGSYYPQEMVEQLLPLLTDTTFVGLTNSADLIIYDRLDSGDLEYYGHGGVVDDDLFIVAGRANYLLYSITGSKLGQVRMNPSVPYLERLACRWNTFAPLIDFGKVEGFSW